AHAEAVVDRDQRPARDHPAVEHHLDRVGRRRVELEDRVVLQREELCDRELGMADADGDFHLDVLDELQVAARDRLAAGVVRLDFLQAHLHGGGIVLLDFFGDHEGRASVDELQRLGAGARAQEAAGERRAARAGQRESLVDARVEHENVARRDGDERSDAQIGAAGGDLQPDRAALYTVDAAREPAPGRRPRGAGEVVDERGAEQGGEARALELELERRGARARAPRRVDLDERGRLRARRSEQLLGERAAAFLERPAQHGRQLASRRPAVAHLRGEARRGGAVGVRSGEHRGPARAVGGAHERRRIAVLGARPIRRARLDAGVGAGDEPGAAPAPERLAPRGRDPRELRGPEQPVGSRRHAPPPPPPRWMSSSCCSISFATVTTCDEPWKPRWITMRSVNSCDRSTFEDSRLPALTPPKSDVFGAPSRIASPVLFSNDACPEGCSPCRKSNHASASWPCEAFCPLEYVSAILPSASKVVLVSAPAASPSREASASVESPPAEKLVAPEKPPAIPKSSVSVTGSPPPIGVKTKECDSNPGCGEPSPLKRISPVSSTRLPAASSTTIFQLRGTALVPVFLVNVTVSG